MSNWNTWEFCHIKDSGLDPKTIHTKCYSAPIFCNLSYLALLEFAGWSVHSVKHCPLLEFSFIFLALRIKLVKAFPVIINAIIFCEQFQSDIGKPMLCREYHSLHNSRSVWLDYSTVVYLQVSNVIWNMWSSWINKQCMNLCQLSRAF